MIVKYISKKTLKEGFAVIKHTSIIMSYVHMDDVTLAHKIFFSSRASQTVQSGVATGGQFRDPLSRPDTYQVINK